MSGHGGRLGDWLGGWLAALRVARREARRAKGRSALVVALIGLPVLGLAFAATSYDTFRLTPAQELDRDLGTADAYLRWMSDGPVTQSVDATAFDVGGEPLTPGDVTVEELLAVLPAGSRAVAPARTDLRMRTATGIGTLRAAVADLTDPIWQGKLVLRDGRGPAGSDEVALTRPAAERLDAAIGDTVTTADRADEWRVVGIVEYPQDFQQALVLHPSAAPDLGITPTAWLVDTPEPVDWDQVRELNRRGLLVVSRAVILDPPPSGQVYEDFRDQQSGDLPQGAFSGIALIGGLAALEVVLLAGPAFAVGARRRQRELALVGAVGGSPAQLRRIVLADGVVLGSVAATVGIVLGVVAGLASVPLLEEHLFQRRAGDAGVWPVALAGAAGLAVLTGLLAALVPATTAARQNLVTALAGRRGVVRSRKRWLALGIVATGAGAAVAAAGAWRIHVSVMIVGLVISQLGLALCTPALVGLVARAGRFLPLSLRIATRDTARNRAAAAPAIAAVMAAVAGALTIGIYLSSDQQQRAERYVPTLPPGYASVHYDPLRWDPQRNAPVEEPVVDADQHTRVSTAVGEHLPTGQVVEVRRADCPADAPSGSSCQLDVAVPTENRCPWLDHRWQLSDGQKQQALADPRCADVRSGMFYSDPFGTVVDDGTALAALTGAEGDDLAAATATLRDGGVVVTDERLVVDGRATVTVEIGSPDTGEPETTRRLDVPAHVLSTGEPVPTVVVSPAVPDRVGLDTGLAGVVATTTSEPTVAQQDAVNAALSAIDDRLRVSVERPPSDTPAELLALAAAAGMVTLGAAGIATGLAGADRRPDLTTLAAVGASPRIRRLLSLSQSVVIAGLGGLLGSAAGVGAAFAVLTAYNQRLAGEWPTPVPYPLTVPWQMLVLVLVVVPTVAMLGAGLFTRSRLPAERRHT